MTSFTRTLALAGAVAASVTGVASGATILTQVEAQRGGTADRLVFTFAGPLPTTVRSSAVARVQQAGSGKPVPMRGAKLRTVVFSLAAAHDDRGRPSCAPRVITPTLDLLVQAKMAGDFEGQVTYGVGLARQVAPQVVRRPAQRQIILVFRR